jgi:alpha-L-fucosidase
MDINKESIFDTRPWKIYGEGPVAEVVNPVNGPGFNEGKVEFSAKDLRYNQKGKVLYATLMGIPGGNVFLKSLGKTKSNGIVKRIEVLGSREKISWKQNADSLVIQKPKQIPNDIAVVFKIYL